MKTFQSIYDFKPINKTILTLGTFDGVHIGHRKIIEKLIQNSTSCKCESLVLTFFPHPRMVLQEKSEIKLLNTIDERIELLKQSGLDNLVIHPFDQAFSRLTAEEFVSSILVDQFNVKKIIIGYDHRFGRNRTADINDLIEFGEKYAFEVEQISAEEIDEVSVSSTKIRNALLEGNIKLANDYLGYDYLLTGTIIKGKGIGRTLNFPTANLQIEENYKLVPKNGVYIVQSRMKNKLVYGMMNIGFNPTVNGESKSIEVHFFDFEGDLYSKKIEIQLLDRIRDEVKFESLEKLKEQLSKDKTAALHFIATL
ncbi:bifunctional riboflavin kinase/FAD synthetase [Flavobacterium piscinae]|uniref:Riboflavin biosynthesis protein n=1 Tax=Flavobacterium piscinae TaxID=2506424 RepID=A0A4Q1L0Z2_9FLAO|nr:bifunctional riboflavin kinase/FAD synthetase [Flavobacterium piscinae]RXR35344.1 bifunctional riboflavin kinase/FAD synthetase [Flavobacterium piscinae]